MGRKKLWSEDMQARFPEGTFDRIDLVLAENEDRTAFVRGAVERELKCRISAAALVSSANSDLPTGPQK